jgi:hypothetical protein
MCSTVSCKAKQFHSEWNFLPLQANLPPEALPTGASGDEEAKAKGVDGREGLRPRG